MIDATDPPWTVGSVTFSRVDAQALHAAHLRPMRRDGARPGWLHEPSRILFPEHVTARLLELGLLARIVHRDVERLHLSQSGLIALEELEQLGAPVSARWPNGRAP